MIHARIWHTATRLENGNVLVTGGLPNAGSPALASAEVYDVASGTWKATGSLAVARAFHAATVLADGRVMAVGGSIQTVPNLPADPRYLLRSAELYDPQMGSWTTTGPMSTLRMQFVAARLPDGRVLAVPGCCNSLPELYDPATAIWTKVYTGFVGEATAAALLRDGRVLAVDNASLESWTFSASDASWTPAQRATGTGILVALPDGRALMTAGGLFDPTTWAWATAAAVKVTAVDFTATALLDGRVLAVGGSTAHVASPEVDIYTP